LDIVLTASPDHLRKATYSPFDCVHPTPERLGSSTVEQGPPNQLSFSVQTLGEKENKNLAVCYTIRTWSTRLIERNSLSMVSFRLRSSAVPDWKLKKRGN
jgi:hypothetical protein